MIYKTNQMWFSAYSSWCLWTWLAWSRTSALSSYCKKRQGKKKYKLPRFFTPRYLLTTSILWACKAQTNTLLHQVGILLLFNTLWLGCVTEPNWSHNWWWFLCKLIISQGSKFKTNRHRKIRLQIFDIWCKNVR